MDPKGERTMPAGFLDRFRKSWFPPAAAVGAFAAFVAAAFRVRPAPKPTPRLAGLTGAPKPAEQPAGFAPATRELDWEYARAGVLGGGASPHPFRRSLAGIAVGSGDRIFALGDDEIRIFDSEGNLVRQWKAPENAACLAIGPDGRVYIGMAGRVEVRDASGNRTAGFPVDETGKPADVTAIKVFQNEILVADTGARLIRRYDSAGRQLGAIGTKNKTGGFILPNRNLDIDVDSRGVVYATDTGRHRVTSWALDGTPIGSFGKFGMSDPKDFVGCCNPVNLALLPDGNIVTAEKMVARVKVYAPDGKLLALIGPEYFDPKCTHIYLVADSRKRIFAADPVRREINVFSRVGRVGTNAPFDAVRPPVEVEIGESELT